MTAHPKNAARLASKLRKAQERRDAAARKVSALADPSKPSKTVDQFRDLDAQVRDAEVEYADYITEHPEAI